MGVLNGIFPGKIIVIKGHKLKKKNFEALKKIYPTALFVTNRDEIKDLKTIFYVSDTNVKNIDSFFFKRYNVSKYNSVHIEETTITKIKRKYKFALSKYGEENFKMYEV